MNLNNMLFFRCSQFYYEVIFVLLTRRWQIDQDAGVEKLFSFNKKRWRTRSTKSNTIYIQEQNLDNECFYVFTVFNMNSPAGKELMLVFNHDFHSRNVA